MSQPVGDERFPWRWVATAMALGATFLGVLWWRNGTFMDADEAVVGLMARHIAFGGALPVYYSGQEYMGAVEAYLAVPIFWIAGSSVQAVKLVPLLFTLATIPVAAQVAFLAADRRAAILAAFAFAIPPLAFSLWTIKTRGGFTEQAELGLIFFWAALRLVEAKTPRAQNLWALSAGLMLGVGLWWGEFVVPFALAGLSVLVLHPRARKGSIWLLGLGGGLVGALPALWRNALTTHWATVQHALRPDPSQASAGQPMHAVPTIAWRNLAQIELPSMLGFHDARADVFHWSWPEGLFPALLCALALLGFFVAAAHAARAKGITARLATVGTLAGGILMLLLYAYSRFGFEREPRYVLAIWLTIAFCDAWGAWALTRLHPSVGAAALALVLGFHVYRTYLVEPSRKIVLWNPDAPATWSWAPLAERLVASGHTHLYADYWTAERLTFESKERVLAVDPHEARDAERLRIVSGDPLACWLSTAGNQADQAARRLAWTRKVYRPADVPGLGELMVLACPR